MADIQIPTLNDAGLHRDKDTNFIEVLTQMTVARNNFIKEMEMSSRSEKVQKNIIKYHLEMINIILKNSAITEILNIYKQLHTDYKTSHMALGMYLTGLITVEDDLDAAKLRTISTLFANATNAEDIKQKITIDTLSNLIHGTTSIIEAENSDAIISNLANYLNQ